MCQLHLQTMLRKTGGCHEPCWRLSEVPRFGLYNDRDSDSFDILRFTAHMLAWVAAPFLVEGTQTAATSWSAHYPGEGGGALQLQCCVSKQFALLPRPTPGLYKSAGFAPCVT
jgi:hypothetical protein